MPLPISSTKGRTKSSSSIRRRLATPCSSWIDGNYDKEIRRTRGITPPSVQHLLPRLKSDDTEVVIVTLPEATPVYEALRLEEDLKRTKLQGRWWIINKAFCKAATTSPLLRAKAAHEIPWINTVHDHTKGHTASYPGNRMKCGDKS